jgi:uncharacterized membrane protein YjjP (DUF1212 family)
MDLVEFEKKERYYHPKKFLIVYFSGFASGLVSGMLGLGAVNSNVNIIIGIGHGASDVIFRYSS